MTPIVSAQWLHNHLYENPSDIDLVILDASPAANKSNLPSQHLGLRIPGARFFDLKNKFSDPEADMPNTLPQPQDFEQACRELGINSNSPHRGV